MPFPADKAGDADAKRIKRNNRENNKADVRKSDISLIVRKYAFYVNTALPALETIESHRDLSF
jgi:hypothetical protein